MTPLEITLIILLATLVAFMTGKIPFSVIASGIILALIMTGVMTPAEAFFILSGSFFSGRSNKCNGNGRYYDSTSCWNCQ